MSRYAVNSLLYRLKKEPEFRARFTADPAAALARIDLSEPERAAFIAGDMRKINELGGYLHLVMSIPASPRIEAGVKSCHATWGRGKTW